MVYLINIIIYKRNLYVVLHTCNDFTNISQCIILDMFECEHLVCNDSTTVRVMQIRCKLISYIVSYVWFNEWLRLVLTLLNSWTELGFNMLYCVMLKKWIPYRKERGTYNVVTLKLYIIMLCTLAIYRWWAQSGRYYPLFAGIFFGVCDNVVKIVKTILHFTSSLGYLMADQSLCEWPELIWWHLGWSWFGCQTPCFVNSRTQN